MTFTVAALYHFTPLDGIAEIRPQLLDVCLANACRGTLLLAMEGINGTIAGPDAGIHAALAWIRHELPGCDDLEVKFSYAPDNPFLRMKVRLKKEIVTMGEPDVDPNRTVGTYVEPEDWNDLISDPDVVVIDTRNDYEVDIGTFKGAINPKTETFREFPDWFHNNPVLNPPTSSDEPRPKVAMFCTGGIRCEKASAFLKDQGVENVYHLKGGILKYLERIPENESLWQGECFVFDQRVAVKHGLDVGSYDQCYACRYPITEADKCSPLYEAGVSCPRCHDKTDAAQKRRFAERQKQMALAKQRGRKHIGIEAGQSAPEQEPTTRQHTEDKAAEPN